MTMAVIIDNIFEVDEQELNMSLILNKPITIITVGTFHQLTLNDMFQFGFSKYFKFVNWMCITSQDIQTMVHSNEQIHPMDFIMLNCIYDQTGEFSNLIFDGLSAIFKEKISINDNGFIIGDDESQDRILTKLMFDFIADLFRKLNFIKQQSIEKKQLNAKQQEYRRILAEKRKKYEKFIKGDETDISDIISSVCSKSQSINLTNVCDLTLYQLIDQFKRLNMIDDYHINIQSLLQGASKDDVKLTHWSSKLK